MRVTKEDATRAFNALCKALGKRVATSYSDKGAWNLSHENGRYQIEELLETGGVSHPIYQTRYTAREVYELCWFAVRAIQAKEQGQ